MSLVSVCCHCVGSCVTKFWNFQFKVFSKCKSYIFFGAFVSLNRHELKWSMHKWGILNLGEPLDLSDDFWIFCYSLYFNNFISFWHSPRRILNFKVPRFSETFSTLQASMLLAKIFCAKQFLWNSLLLAYWNFSRLRFG